MNASYPCLCCSKSILIDVVAVFYVREYNRDTKNNLYSLYYFHDTCFKEVSGLSGYEAKKKLRYNPRGFCSLVAWKEFTGREISSSVMLGI